MRRYDLPVMTACNGCGDCCTEVSARPDEMKRIRHYVRDNGIQWAPPTPDKCGFLRVGAEGMSCAIYEVRPWTCRAYGLLREMHCPHFPEAATLSLPPAEAIDRRLVDPADELLGEVFEPGYLLRLARVKVPQVDPVEAAEALKASRPHFMPYGAQLLREP